MMNVEGKKVVVTGGSRGLGLGLVEALVARGAQVTIVARGAEQLAEVGYRLGVGTICADVAEEGVARHILGDVQPDLLVLNAGAKPLMGRLDTLTWAEFNATWETDVKAGLYWVQAALKMPLKPGSRVLVSSSGAAQNLSPLSGAYAGAKRMLWIMAKYANGVSQQLALGIRFQVIVPMQMIEGTGVGDAGAQAYARAAGVEPKAFLTRFGAPMPPRSFGDKVVSVLEKPEFSEGFALGFNGEKGVTVLEGIQS